MTALRERKQFDVDSGLPASELAALNSPTWFEHAKAYVLMKWPKAAAKQRASIAEALATLTTAFISTSRGAPDTKVTRHALYAWAFRALRRHDGTFVSRDALENPPADVVAALAWIGKHSLKVTEAAQPDRLRVALDALSVRLDGKPAAENTAHRKRMVLSNAMRYAVERDVLKANPLGHIDWTAPDKEDEIEFRYVPNPKQAAALIAAVREQGVRGEHLAAFFGCLYYAAMRPSEIADLRAADCRLPATGWG
ncbi:hypothetical protein AB0D78_14330 [Streptomyces avermitilis]|uniref:hypothetical protein n=1 Tax=Streptomyces avermitilis TaxID=33903 RepID=UPI00340586AD